MEGVVFTPLKQIHHPKGNIFHALKASDEAFSGFGEAYFSFINKHDVKGWKKHTRMHMNLIVPKGKIRFVLYDDRKGSATQGEFQSFTLCASTNYGRLSVNAGVWMAFQGKEDDNMLLNLADIEHDPKEALNAELNHISFDWEK